MSEIKISDLVIKKNIKYVEIRLASRVALENQKFQLVYIIESGDKPKEYFLTKIIKPEKKKVNSPACINEKKNTTLKCLHHNSSTSTKFHFLLFTIYLLRGIDSFITDL